MKVRIKFAKYGCMKFVGHLDMMRFFQKAIRRAQIDIRYSEGFSPHQIMSFAAPLGVGVESLGEYMDIELCSMKTPEELCARLNRNMVEGVQILEASVLPDTAKKAMASVAAASYLLHEKEPGVFTEQLLHAVDGFWGQAVIPYTKETKKNTLELNLKQGIYQIQTTELSVLEEISSYAAARLMQEHTAQELRRVKALSLLVDASSSGNIKPVMVLDALCAYARQEKLVPSSYQITRVETYANLSREGEPQKLVPLGTVTA